MLNVYIARADFYDCSAYPGQKRLVRESGIKTKSKMLKALRSLEDVHRVLRTIEEGRRGRPEDGEVEHDFAARREVVVPEENGSKTDPLNKGVRNGSTNGAETDPPTPHLTPQRTSHKNTPVILPESWLARWQKQTHLQSVQFGFESQVQAELRLLLKTPDLYIPLWVFVIQLLEEHLAETGQDIGLAPEGPPDDPTEPGYLRDLFETALRVKIGHERGCWRNDPSEAGAVAEPPDTRESIAHPDEATGCHPSTDVTLPAPPPETPSATPIPRSRSREERLADACELEAQERAKCEAEKQRQIAMLKAA